MAVQGWPVEGLAADVLGCRAPSRCTAFPSDDADSSKVLLGGFVAIFPPGFGEFGIS